MAKGFIFDLGPCDVYFNSTLLGKTFGAVTFKYTPESRDVKEDQQGVTPVEAIIVGMVGDVTVPLTRMQLAAMATITPGATLVTAAQMDVYNPVGINRYDNAAELKLVPYDQGVASAKWIKFPQAHPSVDLSLAFDVDTQRVYNTIFKYFPSQATPIGQLWSMGQT